eukprot:gnl/MRDRNA2_/MRDRNA2_84870_c0_seq1.p1 gnl/MRDRNA2_/MRDRNA2_84870_c0~~gnl/MRDRNA2_/MRDRNA2_84870_c0_seq1.p1  ORF type:complete len:466 (+),score=89.11 gnl/MRDRNA2_/MRDRNA2_84870_c0_seq1:74-1399(+)
MGGDCRIWVGSLPKDIKENELRDVFQDVGKVVRVDILHSKTDTYSFVHFDDPAAPDDAIRTMNMSSVFGKAIKVNSANNEDRDRDRGKGNGKGDRNGRNRHVRRAAGGDSWYEKDRHDKATLSSSCEDRDDKGSGRWHDDRRQNSRDRWRDDTPRGDRRDHHGKRDDRRHDRYHDERDSGHRRDRYDDKGSRSGKGGYDDTDRDRRDKHWDGHEDEGKGSRRNVGRGIGHDRENGKGKDQAKDRSAPSNGVPAQEVRIWVGGLPKDITNRELDREFGRFGDMQDVFIRNSKHDAFAFVQYARQSQADAAIREMDQSKCFGARIKVNSANVDPKGRAEGERHDRSRSRHRSAERQCSLEKQATKNIVLIKNLPDDMKPEELEDVCGDFGKVFSAKLWDTDDGECKDGCAEFQNIADAHKAIEHLDGRRMQGWDMRIRANLKG